MIVYASAPVVVVRPPRVNPWPGCSITWEGYDPELGGTRLWDLSGGAEGVTIMAGASLFGAPRVETYEDEFPGVDGSRYRAARALPRDGFLPVRVRNVRGRDVGSLDFVDLDASFWRTLHTNRQGILRFTDPRGSTRKLVLRFLNDGDYAPDTEASLVGQEYYGLNMRANQPYWEGAEVTNLWRQKPESNMYIAPNDSDPGVVRLSSSFTLSTATMTNPGEVKSYPDWIVAGQTTRAKLGLAGKTIEIPFEIPAGKAVIVSTRQKIAMQYDVAPLSADKDPQEWKIGEDLFNPRERTHELGAVSWAPIPPGSAVPLSLDMAGTGSVAIRLTPLYKRAR